MAMKKRAIIARERGIINLYPMGREEEWMIKNKGLFMMMIGFIISSMVLGCATTPDRDSLGLTCPICKKEMVHIIEKDKEGKIHCQTCKSEISPGEEHYCPNCGARIEDFSVKVPF